MKKSIFMLLLIGCLMFSFFVQASAAETTANTEAPTVSSVTVEYFEDGSYLVTTIKEGPTARGAVYSKNGYKDITLYNEDDEIQWI